MDKVKELDSYSYKCLYDSYGGSLVRKMHI